MDRVHETRRALAWTGLAIAMTFVVVQACMPNRILPIDMASWLANGLAVAVYGPLIRAAGPRRGVMWSSQALGFVGLTHGLWAPFAGIPFANILRFLGPAPVITNVAPMFLATGIVFTLVVAAGMSRWSSLVIMVTATVLSTLVAAMADRWAIGASPPHVIGFPAALLHIGIALALFLPARADWRKTPLGLCDGCHYDLRGLSAARCPECGRDRSDIQVFLDIVPPKK